MNQAKELMTVRVSNAPDQSLKVALQIRKSVFTTPYTLCRASSIMLQYKAYLLLLNNTAVLLAFLLREAPLIFLDAIFSM